MWLAVVRDIAIVILALESIVIGALLVLTLLQIRTLVRILRDEIRPLLDSANQTMTTVKGTTQFVSKTVVNPLVRVTSYTTGTIQAVKSLFVIGQHVGRRPPLGEFPAAEANGSLAKETSE